VKGSHLGAAALLPGSIPSRLWTWYLRRMVMKTVTGTSVLGRIEAERHQADELRAYSDYSSFGELLHKKEMKSENKAAHSHLYLLERRGLTRMKY
jgi:hypothetical protein